MRKVQSLSQHGLQLPHEVLVLSDGLHLSALVLLLYQRVPVELLVQLPLAELLLFVSRTELLYRELYRVRRAQLPLEVHFEDVLEFLLLLSGGAVVVEQRLVGVVEVVVRLPRRHLQHLSHEDPDSLPVVEAQLLELQNRVPVALRLLKSPRLEDSSH